MADEKHQPPRRPPTFPRVDDQIPDRAPTNEQLPLGPGGQIDVIRTAKMIRRALMIIGGTVVTLVVGFQQALQWNRDHAEKVSAETKQESHQSQEATYQPLLHKVDALTKEVLGMREREAARLRAEARAARRPIRRAAPVAALPPVPRALTQPLPSDVEAAKVAAKVAAPQSSPRGVDSGTQ